MEKLAKIFLYLSEKTAIFDRQMSLHKKQHKILYSVYGNMLQNKIFQKLTGILRNEGFALFHKYGKLILYMSRNHVVKQTI